jgi:hypothetical protein
MKLQDLYPNFSLMNDSAQEQFIGEYRERRFKELNSVVPTSSKKESSVGLTPEEKLAISLLGLKRKDILALRAITPPEPEEGDLFDDNGLVEGDE